MRNLIQAAQRGFRALSQKNGWVTEPNSSDYWYLQRGTENSSGQTVTPDTALRLSAVLACVRVISRAMAALPRKIYQTQSDGTKKLLPAHPIADLLAYQPNSWQTAYEFVEMMQGHFELRGNALALIVPGARGFCDQLVPLHPDCIVMELLADGSLRYTYSDPITGKRSVYLQEEIFHLRAWSANGYWGRSTVEAAAEVVGGGLAAQEYGNRFWANDAATRAVITGGKFKSEDERGKFRENWQAGQGGGNRFKVGMLWDGMDIKELGLKNSDAQYIEFRKFNRAEIAALFGGVPLHMIGETDKAATYASVEQFNIQFAMDCLLPRCIMWEQAIRRDLILDPRGFCKFDLNSRLRGDAASRATFYNTLFQTGALSPNEIRDKEEMNPRDGGNVYLTPLNYRESGPDAKELPEPAQPAKEPVPPPQKSNVDDRLRELCFAAAERCVRKETAAAAKGKNDAEFYAGHAQFLSEVLRIPQDQAKRYCDAHVGKKESDWTPGSTMELVQLALGGA